MIGYPKMSVSTKDFHIENSLNQHVTQTAFWAQVLLEFEQHV